MNIYILMLIIKMSAYTLPVTLQPPLSVTLHSVDEYIKLKSHKSISSCQKNKFVEIVELDEMILNYDYGSSTSEEKKIIDIIIGSFPGKYECVLRRTCTDLKYKPHMAKYKSINRHRLRGLDRSGVEEELSCITEYYSSWIITAEIIVKWMNSGAANSQTNTIYRNLMRYHSHLQRLIHLATRWYEFPKSKIEWSILEDSKTNAISIANKATYCANKAANNANKSVNNAIRYLKKNRQNACKNATKAVQAAHLAVKEADEIVATALLDHQFGKNTLTYSKHHDMSTARLLARMDTLISAVKNSSLSDPFAKIPSPDFKEDIDFENLLSPAEIKNIMSEI